MVAYVMLVIVIFVLVYSLTISEVAGSVLCKDFQQAKFKIQKNSIPVAIVQTLGMLCTN